MQPKPHTILLKNVKRYPNFKPNSSSNASPLRPLRIMS